MQRTRKIIHIDMDAFYASIEQRDQPELKGRPVIVGGRPGERGVVAACSYEARRFGIHSAMSSSLARRLCPQAVFLPPRFEVYAEVSEQIRAVFHEYTDLVEPLSLDEAYLDVTVNKQGVPSASEIAREILARIKSLTGLSASAGVSYNKFLAKVASDYRKPGGLTVITPEKAQAFIDALPVGKFFGVGKVTAQRMQALGIRTGADLKRFSEEELTRHFGRSGSFFFRMAHGDDPRPVEPDWIRKSYGRETTLPEDITDRVRMLEILAELAGDVCETLRHDGAQGRTITLKLKYFDFTSITRSITLPIPTDDAAEIMRHIPELLGRTEAGHRAVRLLGVAVSGLGDQEGKPRAWQLKLPF